MYHLTRPSSPLDRILVPRLVRMYLALWLIRRWRLPATPAFTLPVAVSLKRFFAPDLVFKFGILHVAAPAVRPSESMTSRHGMPMARRLLRRTAADTGKAPRRQGDAGAA